MAPSPLTHPHKPLTRSAELTAEARPAWNQISYQSLPAVGQLVAQVVAGGEPCQVVLSGLPTDAAMKRIEELEHNQQQSSGQSAEAIAQQLKMLEPVKKLDAIVRGILSQVDWARWAPGERGG